MSEEFCPKRHAADLASWTALEWFSPGAAQYLAPKHGTAIADGSVNRFTCSCVFV